MQKLQIKEEIMAVVALLALGTLAVLASGLSAKVTIAAQPKAIFGACMAFGYATTGSISGSTVFNCGLASLGIGYGFDAASKDWFPQLRGQRLSVVLGTRILNALRLAKFASWGAGPLGFFVIAA